MGHTISLRCQEKAKGITTPNLILVSHMTRIGIGSCFVLEVEMAEKKTTPKVRYNDHTYEIVERTGDTIRIKDAFVEFCIDAAATKPTNQPARDLFKERGWR